MFAAGSKHRASAERLVMEEHGLRHALFEIQRQWTQILLRDSNQSYPSRIDVSLHQLAKECCCYLVILLRI